MRIPTRAHGKGVTFNITPLIDVVFLLVIFFLVASHFARNEPSESVDLPLASQTAEEQDARRLTITLRSDGRMFVANEECTLADVEQMIADGAAINPETFAVRIRGDRQTEYRFVEPILLACPKHRITKFGFHVLPKSE